MNDDLAAFLLARIAEDEQACGTSGEPESWCDRAEGAHYDSRRVLAECEAKRRVIKALVRCTDHKWTGTWAVIEEARDALSALALPYREHPDYRAEWAP